MSSSSSLFISILQGPSSRTAVVGLGYADLFSVSALSPQPISYKWQHSVDGGSNYFDINPDGGVFTGSRTSVLGVNAGMTDFSSVWNGARFRCVLESGGQTLVSSAAILTVKDETCNGVVECGGSMYSADCGLLPMPGYNQYMDCTDCKCVSVALASSSSSQPNEGQQIESSSSSSSSPKINIFNFVEIKVQKKSSSSSSSSSYGSLSVFSADETVGVQNLDSSSSSSSLDNSELLVFMVDNPQLLSQMETASKEKYERTCFFVPYNESCPDGYNLEGYDDGCEPPYCNKICCISDFSDLEYVVCARAYLSNKEYNPEWNFYLDPSTIRIDRRANFTGDGVFELAPSEIQASLGSTIAEGSEFCFPLSGNVRVMRMEGMQFCVEPLHVRAIRTFDPTLGQFFQQTSCDGDCEEIYESYCLDDYKNQYYQDLIYKINQAQQNYQMMSDQQQTDYFLNEMYDALSVFDGDGSPEDLFPEDFDQFLNRFVPGSSSSSSSEEEVTEGNVFDYESGGASTSPASPTQISMALGDNFISSVIGSSPAENYFSFSVPASSSLVEVYLLYWSSPVFTGTVAIKSGSSWGSQAVIEQSEVGSGLNSKILPLAMPLQPGTYTMKVSSDGSQIPYMMLLVVEQNEVA